MRKRFCVYAALLLLAFAGVSARTIAFQDAAAGAFYGTWTGTWEGMGATGGFELTLEKGTDAASAGRVTVTGDPSYKATLTTVAFEGKKLTAKYDFPPDETLEVSIEGTMEGDAIKGAWVVRSKTNAGEAASGSWAVKKK